MTELSWEKIDPEAIRGFLILLDIDGTIAPDGSASVAPVILQKIAALRSANDVVFCSNKNNCQTRNQNISDQVGISCLNIPHKKPSRKVLDYLPNPRQLPLLVIGDKFLTDGWFAGNIGAKFIKTARLVSPSDTLVVRATYLIDDVFYFFYRLALSGFSLVRLMRPGQWIKNFFIFIPLFFVKQIFIWDKLSLALWAFLVFCATASAMYIINDIVDVDADRAHPHKCKRPLASGQVKVWQAAILAVLLLLFAGLAVFYKISSIGPVILIYIGSNILYSYYLKRVVIFDILLISGFYLLRVLAGGVATATPISHWLTLCIIFVTLFIVVGKRMAEFRHSNKRAVLHDYNMDLLSHLLAICAGLTIVSYGLYTILGSPYALAVYSIFFVILGIFRYLFIIHTTPDAEFPEKLVFSDKVILGSVVAWALYMYLILYF